MKIVPQVLLLYFLVFLFINRSIAQETNSSPEASRMQKNAAGYMESGDLNNAIITYKQAIKIAPGDRALYQGLGKALFLSGKYEDAENIFKQLTAKRADTADFQLLAASQAAESKLKRARHTLQEALRQFPYSGLLYCEQGARYYAANKRSYAIEAWLNGISNEPGFAENYYYAAKAFCSTKEVIWGILYAETYLLMRHDTVKDDEVKQLLFDGYKSMLGQLASANLPTYNKPVKNDTANTFEGAVLQIYSSLTPVVSDGTTTENLTMIRTRFLMDWFPVYGARYPFSLFSYEDNLVRNGRFDICNQWLFGEVEDSRQFESWNKFHEGDIFRYTEWQASNKLIPISVNYNQTDMKRLFNKRRHGS